MTIGSEPMDSLARVLSRARSRKERPMFCHGLLASLVLLAAASPSQTAPTVTHDTGGPIQTPMGFGIVLNKESSLSREWIAVHDPALPADLEGTPGIKTKFDLKKEQFTYFCEYTVEAKEPLTAIELRVLTFDIWGNHAKSLSATEVVDVPVGQRKFTGEWYVLGENEASEEYASIVYLARVRTASGRVVEADPSRVLEEARKLSKKFAAVCRLAAT